MTTIADVVVDTLEKAGVKRIYGIVGDSLNGITNALQRRKKINWIHTRHEEAAAFAAGAEAQLTGELAVCAGSCGPGNMHLINGLYDCQRSAAPVLAIAAHIPTAEIGSNYFQETDPLYLFKECSHFCEIISVPEQVPRLLKMAIRTALIKQGVAVIIISGDIALQELRAQAGKEWQMPSIPSLIPTKSVLQKAADYLNNAAKVSLFCGIGAANAHKELLLTAAKLKAPVVHTLRGKPFIEYDNPYDVGMTGLIGFSSGYYAMETCDALVLLGTSFPYRQFYPSKPKIIQIDHNGEQLGKRTELSLGIMGDVKSTLQALLPLLHEKKDTNHLTLACKHYEHTRKELDDLARNEMNTTCIHPQYLSRMIDEHADENTIFTCDVGTPTVWAARYLKMNGKRRLLGSFNHGSMANALVQAIGAQASYPERQVIALCGDGGFSMLMGEILTLIQHQLPIKMVIFNNSALSFVEMEMHVGGMLEYGTELINPNFAKMAEAVGIFGCRIDDPQQLDAAIKNSFAHPGPALIDVKVNRHELVMPPTLTRAQIKGFSLYMMKAILNGRGTEILDMVKSNLWR